MFRKILDVAISGRLLETLQTWPWKAVCRFFSIVNNLYWRGIKKLDNFISFLLVQRIAKRIPIKANKIFLINFNSEYQCNPKWICEELLREQVDCDIVWCIRKCTNVVTNRFPSKIRFVRRDSLEFYEELASSKVIVDNSINVIYVGYRPKKGQYYLGTWHGAIGIKRFDANSVQNRKWKRDAYTTAKYFSYLISNSDFETMVYRTSFWKDTPIMAYGHARNDIICEGDTDRVRKIKAMIREQYELPDDVRVCLYAPTFREKPQSILFGGVSNDETPYMIDYERVRRALSTRFGGKWVLFVRLHSRMKKLFKMHHKNGVIDVSTYPDIQELLTVVDVGITDYSSWICEYLLTHRPGFLFATDLDNYENNQRGFYYPLQSMPYPVARDNDELEKAILNFQEEGFAEKCDAFLKDKGCIDDGKSSMRIVARIKEMMREQTI